jgi:phosphoribosylglycinamide formyltransferase-1
MNVAVLASGEGTNLQALLDQVHGREGIEIVGVASSRPDARGLERAQATGVETAVFEAAPPREQRDRELGDWLEQRDVQLIVLAGFMEILSAAFIRRFAGRILNVHPSLLPAFAGVRAVEQALAYGVKLTGVTVHLVDEGVDTGPIVLQEAIECPYSRDIEETEQRIHEVEHRLLPRAVRLFAQGRIRIAADEPRVVRVDDGER